MEEANLTQLKTFKIEHKTDKNHIFLINIILGNDLVIEANQINASNRKYFSNKFNFQEIRENKYFLQFDSLNEIFDGLIERIKCSKIKLEENDINLKIKIPLLSSKNKEIIFGLKQKDKNDNEIVNDLTNLINNQNKENR